jgi:hypothetical protein
MEVQAVTEPPTKNLDALDSRLRQDQDLPTSDRAGGCDVMGSDEEALNSEAG